MERLAGDTELRHEVTTAFLADTRRDIDVLRASQEGGDAAGPRNQTHSLKGPAAAMSGEAVRATAKRLETAAAGGDLDARFEALRDALQG